MFETAEFDASVDSAWGTFRDRLADHLSGMSTDDTLVLDWADESTVDGFAPWIQFLVWDDEYVRAEVSSNPYLAPRYVLTAAAENRLCDLGWERPTRRPDGDPDGGSPAFFVDRKQWDADRVAAMTVTTLREVWSVPHPAFLRTEISGTLADTILVDAAPEPEPAAASGLDERAAFDARDPHELRDLVARTVEQAIGHMPDRDDDGDVALRLGDQRVFIIVHPDKPLVRLWMPLLLGIAGRTRAAENACDLTKRWPGMRFTLDEDRLSASIDIFGSPFVPRHLVDALDQLRLLAPRIDVDFAARFGGTLYIDGPVCDSDDTISDDRPIADVDLPQPLSTLLHLDPDGAGALDPHEVAAVCAYDRDAVLDYLRLATGQETVWNRFADDALHDGDDEVAAACEAEARAWARTHESLRGALRVITLPDRPASDPDRFDAR
ncbi:T3SS (YopN, CesT) and YbjN peptide-binding chaperone 1 [Prescottella subtropica]|uniref:T3SS (YopN, CesT) and YbjN peptide-binding chaperone 1 n=1 Tax=Prescottella subtropica TaxID=2545757 RepID=UPI0010F7696F|nr:hypothetical protein [Prescottella subtropica]